MPKTFVISDTHFGHKKIIPLQNRPFRDTDEMDAHMIAKWNSVVEDGDIVIHLGDFAFGGKENIQRVRRELRGQIILVCGNHDYDPPAMAGLGFDIATKFYSTLYRGQPILFAHRPLDFEHAVGRYRHGKSRPTFLYGHIHANGLKPTEDGKLWESGGVYGTDASINMSVELWQYRPVELGRVLDFSWERTWLHHIVLPEHTKEFEFE
jgi:calcineurin-like phosphoesterase family protein